MARMHSAHYKGAAAEYLAASLCLALGQQVYWPAVQQDSVDFVLETRNGLKRVQVKSAHWDTQGSTRKYLVCNTTTRGWTPGTPIKRLYDILFVCAEGRCWIIPASKITKTKLVLEGGKDRWKQFEKRFITGAPK